MSAVEKLAIHPASLRLLLKLQAELPQGILLSGPEGIGLGTIAKALADTSLGSFVRPSDTKGALSSDGTISVETIRDLYEQTRTKRQTKQIVIIDDADRMSHAAQSAFLKLLEEPGLHITFILTSHRPDALLSTVRSRVQRYELSPITSEQTADFVASLKIGDATKETQLRYLAEGLPAKLSRLGTDGETFATHAKVITDARTMLQGSTYERALIALKYKGNRPDALCLIDSMIVILRRVLRQKPENSIVTQLERLLAVREQVEGNGNTSLQLLKFIL